MRPNLSRVGRDPSQLGQCSDFHRLLRLKAFLSTSIGLRKSVLKPQTKSSNTLWILQCLNLKDLICSIQAVL